MPRELGAAKRSAKWLHDTVGEGNVFTKAQLREAVPHREQVDRRARDLRKIGWVIDTYRDAEGLSPEQLRLVTIGEHCWEPGWKWPKGQRISGDLAREIMDRDNNRCVVCGIASGETYPDDPTKVARLTIGHYVPGGPNRRGSNDPANLRTECALHNETARDATPTPVDADLLKVRVRALSRRDRAELRQWIEEDRRSFRDIETLWSQYRQLPAAVRDEIKSFLETLP